MSSREPEIDVLLATLNGTRFIGEQLDSLFCETFQDFQLIIMTNDGSSDSTLDTIEKHGSRYSDRY